MTEGRSSVGRTTRSKLVWIVPAVTLALGATAAWWSLRGSLFRSAHDADDTSEPPGLMSKATRRNPLPYVSRLRGKGDGASVNELIEIYSKWAQYPDTLEARKVALQALLEHPNVNVALESVLTAMQGDQTRRDQDPLWREAVHGMAQLWDAVTFPLGRNRMYIEEREKPKALLLESLTEIRPEKLSDDQRIQLAADFIDLYPTLEPDQKTAVSRALTTFGNSDVVEILAGRGMGADSHLKVVQERNRAIEAAQAIRLPPVVQETDEEIPAPQNVPVRAPAAKRASP